MRILNDAHKKNQTKEMFKNELKKKNKMNFALVFDGQIKLNATKLIGY